MTLVEMSPRRMVSWLGKTSPRRCGTTTATRHVSRPSDGRAIFTSGTAGCTGHDRWDAVAPFRQFESMLGALMLRLRGIQNQIGWLVVVTLSVAMMNVFIISQESAYQAFHYQAMFQHISIAFAGTWMLRRVDVDIAALVFPSTAFPLVARRSFLGMAMTTKKANVFAFLLSTFRSIAYSYLGRPSTSTTAGSFWCLVPIRCHVASICQMGRTSVNKVKRG